VLQRIRALIGSTHPGPGLAVTLITVLLGVSSGLDAGRIALLGVAMAFDQASVGLSNDWIDADRDRAVGRTDKPVASGAISRGAVRAAAFGCAALALAFTVPLGWRAFLLHAALIAIAWSYNAVLKSTVVSFLPYAVCFGLLPALVTLARPEPLWPVAWVIAAGALLGTGAHFANVLPDLEDDRRTGVRGLGHRIGRLPTILVTWIAFASADVVLAVGLAFSPVAIVGLAIGLTVAVIGVVLAVTRPPTRWQFRLVILGAFVDVVLLVLSGPAILG
jgi:4-hydroxybenzoate polyprenyltransferase